MPVLALAALAGLLALPASSPAASQGYRVDVRGSQTVAWSIDGVLSSQCEKRRGRGGGEVTFRYRSSRSTLAFANAYGRVRTFLFSTTVKATGSQRGTFTDSLEAPCSNFAPGPTLTAGTSSCGPSSFWLRLDAQVRGSALYVTGTEAIERPSTPSRNSYADCPFANVTGGDIANALSPTGEVTGGCETSSSLPMYRQTRELATQGRGLANIALRTSVRSLLRPKRRTTTLSRKVQKSCDLPTAFGPVKAQVTSQITVTLRRSR
jgi:hypothetical protein